MTSCPCGCGRFPKKGRTYAATGCSLRAMRRDPEKRERHLTNLRRAFLEKRIDRWAQPAWERIARLLEREGLALTRKQAAIIRYELAEVIRRAHQREYNTRLMRERKEAA